MARLLWRVFREQWGNRCELTTLVADPGADGSFDSALSTRMRFGARLARQQMAGRVDWVFYSHLGLAQVQRFIASPFKRPYAVFLHDIEAWGPLTTPRRDVLRHAFVRIANSNYTAQRVMDAHPHIGPVEACPLALEPVEHATTVISTPRDIGSRAVLVVGRMSAHERYKGHDQLLEAWPDVTRVVPEARLVFVGMGDDISRLQAKAATIGEASSVLCPGFVSSGELAALYRQAAVFALPSRREGFGLVYLEAMTNRLPCIGSIHDAAGDVIEDGVSGFLVDQSDISALAQRLILLLTNEPLRAEMGAQGARRAAEHFTYPRFAYRLLSLIPAEYHADSAAGSIALRHAR